MEQRNITVIKALEQDIIHGKLSPGARLPSEEKLCERFNASRTLVREAIQQLRGRGLIQTFKGSGSYIADPSLDTLADAMETYSALTDDSAYLELMDFRILLETECARLTALHAGEKIITQIHKTIETMEKTGGDRKLFGEADIAFHLAIAAGSQHKLYATVLHSLASRSVKYAQINGGDHKSHQRVIQTHREIFNAITDGDGDGAATAMKRHLIVSRRHYLDIAN